MAGTRGSGISPVQQQYLDVLRSALWGGTLNSLPEDIPGVLEIANRQKTRPLVLDALQKAGYEDPESMILIYRNTSTHVKLNRNISRLVTLFREAGIDPVLLKGQGIALNYPEPMLRECGDIDLYVGQEQYESACALIKGQESTQQIEENKLHLTVKYNKAVVEIHRVSASLRNRKQNEYYQSIADKGLGENLCSVVIDGAPINTPADSFNAFYLFYHFLHHAIEGGIGLRQICDWALFLHSRAGRLDTSVIEQACGRLGISKCWQLYASIAVDYLGLPAAEMPFYKQGLAGQSAKVLALIFKDGNFGHSFDLKEGRPGGLLSGKLFSMKKILSRFGTLYSLYPEMRPMIKRVCAQYLFGGVSRISKDSV